MQTGQLFKMSSRIIILPIVLAIFALLTTVSPAQEDDTPDKPWAKDVSAANQKEAFKFFDEGNSTFGERSYTAALRSYKEAIKYWDHPAIRFNMAVCQIHLDQPVLAFENLEKALAFGVDPLGAATFERALTNRKLLKGQLAYLEIKSLDSQAQVTLDGQPAMSPIPGTTKHVLAPGRHQIVAKRSGYRTQTEDVVLIPSETTKITIKLTELGSIPMVRRWSAWKPWAVVGGGALLVATGVGLQLSARDNANTFDRYINEECSSGCTKSELPGNIVDAQDASSTQNVLSLSMFGVGAAVVASGAVLIILNRPRRVQDKPSGSNVSITPIVGQQVVGLSLLGRY